MWLLVCCRQLIQGCRQVGALVSAGLAAGKRVTTISGYIISEVAWKKDYLRKTVAFGFVATMVSYYCVMLCKRTVCWVCSLSSQNRSFLVSSPDLDCCAECFGDDLASYRNSSISCKLLHYLREMHNGHGSPSVCLSYYALILRYTA